MNKKARIFVGVVLLALSLCLAACEWRPADEEDLDTSITDSVEAEPEIVGGFTFTKENWPAVGGSLALLPLAEAVTAAALDIPREEAGTLVQLENSTTWNYEQLVDGNFDLLLAYEPSQEALDYAEEAGFEWEMQPIGRDALVFIANIDNPVHELTTQQITEIYTGKITNWSELGGNDSDIIPYQRNSDSGSQTLFDLFFPLGDELMTPPSEQIVGSMIGLLEVIADYDNSVDALGYTVYYYLTNMETDKLSRSQVLAVDGIEATNETIASGEYPYTNDFYVVIPANLPDDDPARVLFNWICSDQVKELAERENYVML